MAILPPFIILTAINFLCFAGLVIGGCMFIIQSKINNDAVNMYAQELKEQCEIYGGIVLTLAGLLLIYIIFTIIAYCDTRRRLERIEIEKKEIWNREFHDRVILPPNQPTASQGQGEKQSLSKEQQTQLREKQEGLPPGTPQPVQPIQESAKRQSDVQPIPTASQAQAQGHEERQGQSKKRQSQQRSTEQRSRRRSREQQSRRREQPEGLTPGTQVQQINLQPSATQKPAEIQSTEKGGVTQIILPGSGTGTYLGTDDQERLGRAGFDGANHIILPRSGTVMKSVSSDGKEKMGTTGFDRANQIILPSSGTGRSVSADDNERIGTAGFDWANQIILPCSGIARSLSTDDKERVGSQSSQESYHFEGMLTRNKSRTRESIGRIQADRLADSQICERPQQLNPPWQALQPISSDLQDQLWQSQTGPLTPYTNQEYPRVTPTYNQEYQQLTPSYYDQENHQLAPSYYDQEYQPLHSSQFPPYGPDENPTFENGIWSMPTYPSTEWPQQDWSQQPQSSGGYGFGGMPMYSFTEWPPQDFFQQPWSTGEWGPSTGELGPSTGTWGADEDAQSIQSVRCTCTRKVEYAMQEDIRSIGPEDMLPPVSYTTM